MAKKPPKKHLTISRIDADTFKINRRIKWEPPADYLPGEPLAKRVCEYLHDQIADWGECEPDNPLVHDISKCTQHGTEWTTRDELSKAGHLLAHARHARDMEAKGKPIEWSLIDVGYRVAELNYIEAWRKQMQRDKQQIEARETAAKTAKKRTMARDNKIKQFADDHELTQADSNEIWIAINTSTAPEYQALKAELTKLKPRPRQNAINQALRKTGNP